MASKALNVLITGDASGFDRTVRKVESSTTRMQSGFSKASTKQDQLFGKIKGFATGATLAYGVAGAAVLKFGVDSVKAYTEHQRVVVLLQNQLQKMPQLVGATTKAFEEQATAIQNLTGFTDEQILAADTVLTRFQLTERQIKQAIPVVADYARAVGTDVPTAATAIGRALLGNTRALKTIGINFKATGDRAKDFATVMRLLRGRVGGTAEAFGRTFEGKLQILKARFNDLQEAIGKGLLPVLTKAAEAATGLLDAFNKVGGAIGGGRITALFDLVGGANLGSAAVNLLSGNFKEAGRRALDFINPLDSIGRLFSGNSDKGKEAADATKKFGDAAGTAAPKVAGLADAMEREAPAIHGIGQAFDNLAKKAKLSAQDIIDAFNKQITAQQRYQENWDTLVNRHLPDAFLKQLEGMGADGARIVATLAGANDSAFSKIIGKWLSTQAVAQDTALSVGLIGEQIFALPNGKIIRVRLAGSTTVTRELNDLRNAIYSLPGSVTVIPRRVGHKGGSVTPTGIFHQGGPVKMHRGDEVPAILQTGEFVMRRSAVNQWGLGLLRAMNTPAVSGLSRSQAVPLQMTNVFNEARDPQEQIRLLGREAYKRGW